MASSTVKDFYSTVKDIIDCDEAKRLTVGGKFRLVARSLKDFVVDVTLYRTLYRDDASEAEFAAKLGDSKPLMRRVIIPSKDLYIDANTQKKLENANSKAEFLQFFKEIIKNPPKGKNANDKRSQQSDFLDLTEDRTNKRQRLQLDLTTVDDGKIISTKQYDNASTLAAIINAVKDANPFETKDAAIPIDPKGILGAYVNGGEKDNKLKADVKIKPKQKSIIDKANEKQKPIKREEDRSSANGNSVVAPRNTIENPSAADMDDIGHLIGVLHNGMPRSLAASKAQIIQILLGVKKGRDSTPASVETELHGNPRNRLRSLPYYLRSDVEDIPAEAWDKYLAKLIKLVESPEALGMNFAQRLAAVRDIIYLAEENAAMDSGDIRRLQGAARVCADIATMIGPEGEDATHESNQWKASRLKDIAWLSKIWDIKQVNEVITEQIFPASA